MRIWKFVFLGNLWTGIAEKEEISSKDLSLGTLTHRSGATKKKNLQDIEMVLPLM
jgi:hypothetical protein